LITASALKRNCAYPGVLSKIAPTTAKERDARARRDAAGGLGTMFHAAIEAWAQAGWDAIEVVDPEVRGWLELLAASGWAPTPGMMFEVAAGLTWDGAGVLCDEPQPHVYVARDGSQLATAGRADVASSVIEDGWHLVVIDDWKTGKWPVDPPARNLQVTALALALCQIAGADGFRRRIYYVRDGYLDADQAPVLVGSAEYRQALTEVWEAAALDDKPHPGEHCDGCWEKRMKRCAHAA
jgi:hypothetical protein